jgi:hypothetical protein
MINKTEQMIMDEIEKKGYANIEHGIIKRRPFGGRLVNARNNLLDKGLVKITRQTTEHDSERGFGSVFYLSTVEKNN